MTSALIIFGVITVGIISIFMYTLHRVNKEINLHFDDDDENDGIY
jgi:hypothetical protein